MLITSGETGGKDLPRIHFALKELEDMDYDNFPPPNNPLIIKCSGGAFFHYQLL